MYLPTVSFGKKLANKQCETKFILWSIFSALSSASMFSLKTPQHESGNFRSGDVNTLQFCLALIFSSVDRCLAEITEYCIVTLDYDG